MIKEYKMSGFRACLRFKNHKGKCTPNLIGMHFGKALVLKEGPYYIYKNRSRERTWICKNMITGVIFKCLHSNIIKGNASGRNHGFSRLPEYGTVTAHWRWIFTSTDPVSVCYKSMPFCDKWNPRKGGSLYLGAKWIIDNLGKKPGPEWSIDIIKHERGFVPGNLRWALKHTQKRNQRHRKLGTFTIGELKVEAKRHGYKLVQV